ncbi:RhoGAP-domain-containing protein [Plenodomus tracheiphilus IPT5]|uniref:RhoGAP-domain-containing protein n=1 Tax=Plenodomus tracheiphilus IPT5 TaxID=1408161 RepID=A0A6A7B7F9_9PLEO|nr:RhoGAP-domain-containing protein [Plenodomus tracheiphilus IPT5]
MPAGTQNNPHTPRVRNGEPQAALATPEPASSRRDLTSWWRQFSKRPAKKEDEKETAPQGIFGVALIQSIPYANVAISLFNEHNESYIYGYVPIVVAKCGVYLKEKATDVEGIFRLAGSEKRIKELKTAFDTPPRYGKGLDWTGYTVHDAANILRRYFNNLPEPIIPLQHYDPFRQPLRNHQAEAVGPIEGQDPSIGGFDPDAAVRIYQHQIKALPSLNRQLLLYILDLLAVFAAKADVNKMTTSNLAAIFQPGILSHPQHDMSPADYRLSQDVLIFLIDNQDHFLIGMEGTAVDEGTAKQIESGPPTPQARTPTTPGRNNSGIVRSASTTSSAGAESLRMYGGVRRNVSTSSKRSRRSGAVPSPITPAFSTPPSSSVNRSNTLPSKRSPAIGSPRFPFGKVSGSSTPVAEEVKSPLSPPLPADASVSVANAKQETEETTKVPEPDQPVQPVVEQAEAVQPTVPEPEPAAAIPQRSLTMPPQKIEMPAPFAHISSRPVRPMSVTPAMHEMPGGFPLPSPGVIPPSAPVTPDVPAQITEPLLPVRASTPLQRSPYRSPQRSPHHTPTRERSEFLEGPLDSGPSAELTPAVRTFTQILSKVAASPPSDSKDERRPKKLQKKRGPHGAIASAHSSTHSLTGGEIGFGGSQVLPGLESPLQPPYPPFAHGQSQASGSKEGLHSYNSDTISSRHSGTTLKPSMSPSASFRSHSTATEYSEAEQADEVLPKEERRSFWKGHKRGESRATPTASSTDLYGSVPGGDKSMSSFASSSGNTGGGRRSLQYDSNPSSETSVIYGSPPDQDRSEKNGAFGWFHKMRQGHQERVDKKERAKSPPGSFSRLPPPQSLMQPLTDPTTRGRTMDATHAAENTRPKTDKNNEMTSTGSTAASIAAPVPSSSPVPVSATIPPTIPEASEPKLRHGSMALRTDLPAALFEKRSVAQSPNRNPASPDATIPASLPTPEPAPLQNAPVGTANSEAVTESESVAPASQPFTPPAATSGSHHASSDSSVTITPTSRPTTATNIADATPSETVEGAPASST